MVRDKHSLAGVESANELVIAITVASIVGMMEAGRKVMKNE
jgi:hypothetical protein